MKRRAFLTGASATYAISMLDWMRFFGRNGVPGSAKSLGVAEAAAQAAPGPRFLLYWFLEGGWDGYSMFNPVSTRNDALGGSTLPNTDQIHRPAGITLVDGKYPVSTQGRVRYGHLAAPGTSLFNDMAVVSSHHGGTFHSGSRLQYHMGMYKMTLSGKRGPDERSVLQAFAEAYGASYLLPHVSWHNWLADGELSPANYPEGTGYYEKLGPAHAHTVYGNTPARMRQRIAEIAQSRGTARDAEIHAFVDNLHANFLADKHGESVKAFAAAVQAHKSLVSGGRALQASQLFTDPALRAEFGVKAEDEQTSTRNASGEASRSKNSPRANVQALMAYELMTRGLSAAFWIESREIRGFDTHCPRSRSLGNKGTPNQKAKVDAELWTPLKALVAKLKATPYGATGKSYWEHTTIVLASEMGRTMSGADDDICTHLNTSSVVFMGAGVKGGTQYGGVSSETFEAIPIMPDGSLDPAFDLRTGQPKPGATKSPASFVSDAGHVYATALDLAGIPKAAQNGKNDRPPLSFVRK